MFSFAGLVSLRFQTKRLLDDLVDRWSVEKRKSIGTMRSYGWTRNVSRGLLCFAASGEQRRGAWMWSWRGCCSRIDYDDVSIRNATHEVVQWAQFAVARDSFPRCKGVHACTLYTICAGKRIHLGAVGFTLNDIVRRIAVRTVQFALLCSELIIVNEKKCRVECSGHVQPGASHQRYATVPKQRGLKV